MSNRIEETNIPAGTRIRTGAPAEKPQAALDALSKLFLEKQNVISARLGLMEMLYPDGKSEFTYAIGIQCSSDEAPTIQQAVEVLQSAPPGRWPISIFPPTNQYFTKDAIIFFGSTTDALEAGPPRKTTDLETLKEKTQAYTAAGIFLLLSLRDPRCAPGPARHTTAGGGGNILRKWIAVLGIDCRILCFQRLISIKQAAFGVSVDCDLCPAAGVWIAGRFGAFACSFGEG
jgi:hypothetical protein